MKSSKLARLLLIVLATSSVICSCKKKDDNTSSARELIDVPGQKIKVELSWKNEKDIDLDLSCFLKDATGALSENPGFVFYNNLQSVDGAIVHNGESDSGKEIIEIDCSAVSPDTYYIDFYVSTYADSDDRLNDSKSGTLKVLNGDSNKKLMQFKLGDCSDATAVLEAFELLRDGSGWKIREINTEHLNKTYLDICEDYGIDVTLGN